MIDDILETIPWEDVGKAVLGAGAAILGTLGVLELGSRVLTGKGMFEHLRKLSAGLEDRLRNWMERQKVNNVIIKKFVFVCETFNTLLNKGNDIGNTIGKAFVKVKIYGQTSSGRKVNTGEEMVMRTTKSEAKGLTDKHEMIATLDELGF